MAAVSLREWCVPGFSAGFCCWQAGHLAVVVARLVLVRRVHVLEFLHNFHFCYCGNFVRELIEQIAGWPRKEVGIPTVAHLAFLIIENCNLMPQMSIHMGKKYPHMPCLSLLFLIICLQNFCFRLEGKDQRGGKRALWLQSLKLKKKKHFKKLAVSYDREVLIDNRAALLQLSAGRYCNFDEQCFRIQLWVQKRITVV